MTEIRTTTEQLQRYINGEVPKDEALRIEQELQTSAALRLELDTLRNLDHLLPQALDLYQPSETDWERIEERLFTSLRTEQRQSRRSRARWGLIWAPAILAAIALIAITTGLFHVTPQSATQPGIASLDNLIGIDTGSEDSSGLTASIENLDSGDQAKLALIDPNGQLVRAGDILKTDAKTTLRFRLNQRATLTLGERSELRFHESGGKVHPYLHHGAVAVDVLHDENDPFLVFSQGTRLVDIGTRFIVRSDRNGNGSVDVLEGAVQVQRGNRQQIDIREGENASWQIGQNQIQAGTGLTGRDLFERRFGFTPEQSRQVENLNRPDPRMKLNTPSPKTNDPRNRLETDPVLEARPKAVVQRTSWQLTLENLAMPQRDAIGRFYSVVDKQMRSGYTLRAIANLKNFISQHPGPESEKARFLLGECHHNLQEHGDALRAYLAYITLYPQGTWIEVAKVRFAEARDKIK